MAGCRSRGPDWTVEPADVLLADGTIAVIRPLRLEDLEPCWTSTSTSPRTPCGCGSSRRAGRPAAGTSRTSSTTPTSSPRRWSRSSAAGSPGWPPPRCSTARPGRGGLPRLRPGPRSRPRQPAAGAPRGAGSGLRRHPLRRRGAGGQQRDAARVPRRRLRDLAAHRDGRGHRRAAHRRVRRRPGRGRPPRVARRGAVAAAVAGAAQRRRGRRTPRGQRRRPGDARRDPVGRVRRRGSASCTRKVRRWPGWRRTPRSPTCPTASTWSSWSCRPTGWPR